MRILRNTFFVQILGKRRKKNEYREILFSFFIEKLKSFGLQKYKYRLLDKKTLPMLCAKHRERFVERFRQNVIRLLNITRPLSREETGKSLDTIDVVCHTPRFTTTVHSENGRSHIHSAQRN